MRNSVGSKKIIYHWSGRGTSAPLAAALHLGLVEPVPAPAGTVPRRPTGGLAGAIPFGRGAGREKGTLIFLGTGKEGEKVYLLPRGRDGKLLITLIRETARLLGEDPETYCFVDCERGAGRQPGPGKTERAKRAGGLFHRMEELVLAVKEDLLPGP